MQSFLGGHLQSTHNASWLLLTTATVFTCTFIYLWPCFHESLMERLILAHCPRSLRCYLKFYLLIKHAPDKSYHTYRVSPKENHTNAVLLPKAFPYIHPRRLQRQANSKTFRKVLYSYTKRKIPTTSQ